MEDGPDISVNTSYVVNNDMLDNVTLFDYQVFTAMKSVRVDNGLIEVATGCFVGDTEILTVRGASVKIEDLVGIKKFYTYSCELDGTICIGKGHSARVTKLATTLIKITLSSGMSEVCTLDHRWMLRDGSYVEAQNLRIDNQLMNSPVNSNGILGKTRNITVKSTGIFTCSPTPVYDISVNVLNNFTLSSGVCVHNSGKTEILS